MIPAVVFFAIFTQSVAGFGMTLVAMPILGNFYDLKLISPLVALVGIFAKVLLLMKYGSSFDYKVMWRLTLASLLFVPLGVNALNLMDKNVALDFLGCIVLAYALYSLRTSTLLKMGNHIWAFFFGAIAGFLGGAFNASGPPVVVYASAREWLPSEFKGNLQGYALINGLFISANHLASGNVTGEVWQACIFSIPAVLLGVWVGVSMDRYINPEIFKKIVLWLLVVLGIRLIMV